MAKMENKYLFNHNKITKMAKLYHVENLLEKFYPWDN